jgi:hypothetical protein
MTKYLFLLILISFYSYGSQKSIIYNKTDNTMALSGQYAKTLNKCFKSSLEGSRIEKLLFYGEFLPKLENSINFVSVWINANRESFPIHKELSSQEFVCLKVPKIALKNLHTRQEKVGLDFFERCRDDLYEKVYDIRSELLDDFEIINKMPLNEFVKKNHLLLIEEIKSLLKLKQEMFFKEDLKFYKILENVKNKLTIIPLYKKTEEYLAKIKSFLENSITEENCKKAKCSINHFEKHLEELKKISFEEKDFYLLIEDFKNLLKNLYDKINSFDEMKKIDKKMGDLKQPLVEKKLCTPIKGICIKKDKDGFSCKNCRKFNINFDLFNTCIENLLVKKNDKNQHRRDNFMDLYYRYPELFSFVFRPSSIPSPLNSFDHSLVDSILPPPGSSFKELQNNIFDSNTRFIPKELRDALAHTGGNIIYDERIIRAFKEDIHGKRKDHKFLKEIELLIIYSFSEKIISERYEVLRLLIEKNWEVQFRDSPFGKFEDCFKERFTCHKVRDFFYLIMSLPEKKELIEFCFEFLTLEEINQNQNKLLGFVKALESDPLCKIFHELSDENKLQVFLYFLKYPEKEYIKKRLLLEEVIFKLCGKYLNEKLGKTLILITPSDLDLMIKEFFGKDEADQESNNKNIEIYFFIMFIEKQLSNHISGAFNHIKKFYPGFLKLTCEKLYEHLFFKPLEEVDEIFMEKQLSELIIVFSKLGFLMDVTKILPEKFKTPTKECYEELLKWISSMYESIKR